MNTQHTQQTEHVSVFYGNHMLYRDNTTSIRYYSSIRMNMFNTCINKKYSWMYNIHDENGGCKKLAGILIQSNSSKEYLIF